ncbi:hypothetical protein [Sporocytophaga myxococcoides]|nr:hypothetical protein [Sporocytophaga myxococcoides]
MLRIISSCQKVQKKSDYSLSKNYENGAKGITRNFAGTNDADSIIKLDTSGIVFGSFDDADQGDEGGYIFVIDTT